MTSESKYPELDQMFGAYFNQDFDLWGDTIEEIVASYKDGTSRQQREGLLEEIDRFVGEYPDDLDAQLSARYGYDFDPVPWGHTARSFLDEVQRILRTNP